MSLTDTVILYKDPDQVFPKEKLEEAAKDHKHSVTLASIQDGKIIHVTNPGECDVDGTIGIIEANFKAVPLVILLSKVQTLQPWPVIGDANDPDVVAFIQGDPISMEGIVKEVKKIHKGSEDLADFWTALQGSEGRILPHLVGDGCVMFLNRDGGWHACYNANIEVEHDWGCLYGMVQADTGGKPEPAVEPKPADGPKGTPSPFGALTKPATGDTKPPTATSGATKFPMPTSGVPVARNAENTGALPFKPGEEAHFRCPDTVQIPGGSSFRKLTREEVQAWHIENLGYLPKNYKDKPICPEAFRKAPAIPKIDGTATSGAALATASGVKDVAPKHIPPPIKIDESTLKDFQSTFCVKVFGPNMEQLQNLDIMFAELDDIPTVAEKLKLTENFFDGMPHTARYHMCVEQPLVASRVLGDTNRRLHNMKKRMKELEDYVKAQEEEILALKDAAKKSSSPFGSLTKKAS